MKKYEVMTTQDTEMDNLRREYCMCHHCKKLKPNQVDNCVMAEVQFALCKTKGMAQMVTRCADFEEDDASW